MKHVSILISLIVSLFCFVLENATQPGMEVDLSGVCYIGDRDMWAVKQDGTVWKVQWTTYPTPGYYSYAQFQLPPNITGGDVEAIFSTDDSFYVLSEDTARVTWWDESGDLIEAYDFPQVDQEINGTGPEGFAICDWQNGTRSFFIAHQNGKLYEFLMDFDGLISYTVHQIGHEMADLAVIKHTGNKIGIGHELHVLWGNNVNVVEIYDLSGYGSISYSDTFASPVSGNVEGYGVGEMGRCWSVDGGGKQSLFWESIPTTTHRLP